MKNFRQLYLLLFIIVLGLPACKQGKTVQKTKDDGIIEVVFLQMNDVYEVTPLEGGKTAGLARVATVRKNLLQTNPNTFTVLAGDFLSPSLLATVKYEGTRIKGRQMVDVLNTLGLDIVTFGNHEFDIKEDELQSRLNESKFKWVSANVRHKMADQIVPFSKRIDGKEEFVPETLTLDVKDADGTTAKIGMFGVTVPYTKTDYVEYADAFRTAGKAVTDLSANSDAIVALTHLDVDDDKKLVAQYPKINLLMGGHDHDHMYHKVGESIVAKADANAKTVYIHRVIINKNTKKVNIISNLMPINDQIPNDSLTNAVAQKWLSVATNSFSQMGFNVNEVITHIDPAFPWDGRESTVRHRQCNMGQIIAKSMSAAYPTSDCALLNSGSIRVDDQLGGDITQFDILRTLPFGGYIVEVEMNGSLLEKILQAGLKNITKGGYLQWDRIQYRQADNRFLVQDKEIDPNRVYHVVLPDFLLTGVETNLDFLKPDNPEIVKITKPDPADKSDFRNDVRQVVIEYIKKLK
ncbi:bifunctional metallophosphatase/5'-nucleotidase [Sphingobacteriales bacterium UPWRP_1]|nr:hypothetical protein BVG80_05825 [Sphingobacteriales bacterium TSM_CSM]PSJ71961.1 bifunctional metallophosphatase/5'-nucleotidase [Sphingobacteriales bacterium UPWRP_1]